MVIIDDKSRGKPRRKTLQQIEVVFPIIAGKVKGIALGRILEVHGGMLRFLGAANLSHFSDQVLPLRPRHVLRKLPQFLEFGDKPFLLVRHLSQFLLLKQIAMALLLLMFRVPPEAESPETAALSGGGRLFTVGIVWCGHLQMICCEKKKN